MRAHHVHVPLAASRTYAATPTMPAAAAAARKKKAAAPSGRSFVAKRGQVLRRVLASLFAWSWVPAARRRLLQFWRRHNRFPRGRRGNRVPAGGGHVEPEPDVAAARRAGGRAHHH